MEKKHQNKYRTVNSTLGKTPSIGPIPAPQLFPWSMAILFALFVHQIFDLNWIWTILIAAWGISTWWILTASGEWKILSKFINPPNWIRVRVTYKPILQTRNDKRRNK